MATYVLAEHRAPASKPAIEVLGTRTRVLTYAQLRAQVASIATGLLQEGLRPGDRLMLRLGNRVEFPIAYLSAIWAGIIPIPTSAQLTTDEVTKLSNACAPQAILAEDGLALPDAPLPPIIRVEELPHMTDLPPASPEMGDPDRLAYIVFTSGTSGTQRGVCHAHRAVWARRMMHQGWYGLKPDDRLLHAGAFNWTYTLGTGLMDPWAIGATALIPAGGTDISALPGLIEDAQASLFAAAPGIYRRLLRQNLPALPSLRHGLSAGEHLPQDIRQAWQMATGTDLHQAMGMSECSTFISSSPANPADPDSSGRPQPGRHVAILRDDVPVPHGQEGELAISTDDPGLMLGYLDGPPLPDRWFLTGDIATMQPDGSITYLGRSDDMMNPGGHRVSPLEVEAHFAPLTPAAAVQVSPKPGAQVIALYYTGDTDEQTLRAHAEQGLARYKQPRLYFPVASLPYGANGKLNRRALRDRFEAP